MPIRKQEHADLLPLLKKQPERLQAAAAWAIFLIMICRLEIGWSWLGTDFRSTGINRHAKYSMMKYAFDELQFERVEFKTDVLNARARKGLQNVGGRKKAFYEAI